MYFQDLALKNTGDDTFTTITKKIIFLTAINCTGQKLDKCEMITSVKYSKQANNVYCIQKQRDNKYIFPQTGIQIWESNNRHSLTGKKKQ